MRPNITAEDVPHMMEFLFSLRVSEVSELPSYYDRNFHVTVKENVDNMYISETQTDGYVFKVLNSDQSVGNHMDAEHGAMNVLADKGFVCPRVVLNKEGRGVSFVCVPSDKKRYDSVLLRFDDDVGINPPQNASVHQCRLVTYISGTTLHKIIMTTDLLYQVGAYTARVQDALKNFDHPALHRTRLVWTLQAVPRLLDMLDAVSTPHRQNLVQSVLNTLDSTGAKLNQAKCGTIHGDMNDGNIIMASNGQSTYTIKGMIDFGDVHCSPYVYELGTVIMYMMLEGRELDLLEIGRHVLAGYQSVTALSHTELELVRLCVAVRYAQSLVIGEYSCSKEPDNEYLTITPKVGWPQLERFWTIPQEKLFEIWEV